MMSIKERISVQVVSLADISRRDALSKLRSIQAGSYELIVERGGSLIRYCSDVVTLVYYEIWYQALRELEPDGVYTVCYFGRSVRGEKEKRLAIFKGGVCTQDVSFADYEGAYLDNGKLYTDDNEINYGDIALELIPAYEEELEKYHTSNLTRELLKYRKIGFVLGGAVLGLCIAGAIYGVVTKPKTEIVTETVYVEVDPYKDYRAIVNQKRTSKGAAESLRFAWKVMTGLPVGWMAESITLDGDNLISEVTHGDGSFTEVSAYKKSLGSLSKYLTLNGQESYIQVPIASSSGEQWAVRVMNYRAARDMLMVLGSKAGASIRSKKEVSSGVYVSQSIEFSFEDVDLLTVSEFLEVASVMPAFLTSLEIKRSTNGIDTAATLEFEVIGNDESR
ncbi:hypothetical protein [Vibrio mediterranei]|uniref:hypothetical protein n=1 Tax=Vibrio mediterranei TaxID=689 RepID=UPI004068FACD